MTISSYAQLAVQSLVKRFITEAQALDAVQTAIDAALKPCEEEIAGLKVEINKVNDQLTVSQVKINALTQANEVLTQANEVLAKANIKPEVPDSGGE